MHDRTSSQSGIEALREIEERVRARLSVVEDRNSRLQKQVRVLSLGLTFVVLLLLLVWLGPGLVGARATGEVLEARSFRIMDAQGNLRGEWSVDDQGNARLSIMDQQRRPRLNLTVRSDGFPGMALANDEGQRRAVLGLLPDETTTLVFADGRGIPRAVLGLTQADAANLVFADAEGVTRMGMGLDGAGLGSVMMPPDTALEGSGPTSGGAPERSPGG